MKELEAKIKQTSNEIKQSVHFRDELQRVVNKLSLLDLALSSTKVHDALEPHEVNGISELLFDVSDSLKTLIQAK